MKCILLIVLIVFSILACNTSEDPQYNLNGSLYPKGIEIIDLTDISDCTLPACDPLRLARISLTNVRALVDEESEISVSLTFDSIIKFEVCNQSLSEYRPGDWVSVSGIGRDGCGYLNSNFPIEEHYYLFITKIEHL